MLNRYLRTRCNRDKEIAALDEQIAQTANNADPCERWMRYQELLGEADRLRLPPKGRELVKVHDAGIVVALIGGAIGFPLVIAAGFAMMAGVYYTSHWLGKDSRDAAEKRSQTCVDGYWEVQNRMTAQDIAQSPSRERLMKDYPRIRTAFGAAVAKIVNAQALAPAPRPARGGFNL